jgi:hypothetical protein
MLTGIDRQSQWVCKTRTSSSKMCSTGVGDNLALLARDPKNETHSHQLPPPTQQRRLGRGFVRIFRERLLKPVALFRFINHSQAIAMNHTLGYHCDDGEEDSRKPAARPTILDPGKAIPDAMDATATILPTTTIVPPPSPGAAELPFLVTHWLAGFAATNSLPTNPSSSAHFRIQQAAGDLAAAFSALGAFGTTINVRLHLLKEMTISWLCLL